MLKNHFKIENENSILAKLMPIFGRGPCVGATQVLHMPSSMLISYLHIYKAYTSVVVYQMH